MRTVRIFPTLLFLLAGISATSQAQPALNLVPVVIDDDLTISLPQGMEPVPAQGIDTLVKRWREPGRTIEISYGAWGGRGLGTIDNVDHFSRGYVHLNERPGGEYELFYDKSKPVPYISYFSLPDIRRGKCEGRICSNEGEKNLSIMIYCETKSCQDQSVNIFSATHPTSFARDVFFILQRDVSVAANKAEIFGHCSIENSTSRPISWHKGDRLPAKIKEIDADGKFTYEILKTPEYRVSCDFGERLRSLYVVPNSVEREFKPNVKIEW